MYSNEDSMFRREQAKELYLWSDKTQKEIGEAAGVSDRTIRQWIKQFRWNELKYRINHPPATFTEGIRIELTNLQTHILAKDCGFPNKEEVNTMHRLILCLQKLTILPQHDHTTQLPVISNPASAGEKSAEQTDNSLACPPEFIPNETSGEGAGGGTIDNTSNILPNSSKETSAFVDNSLTILPPSAENLSVISNPPSAGEKSPESTEDSPNSELPLSSPSPEPPLSAPQTPPSSEDPPLTYREKMWELAKKDAKKKGLWHPPALPSDLLEPGTPEWEEREKKRLARVAQIMDEMRREQYRYKRRNDW